MPDALHAMGSCFQAGFSLLQTFQQLAGEIKGPLGKRFAACAHLLETGHGSSEALGALRAGGKRSELAFVAVALDVQHQAGGSMRPVLEAARETVEGELALRRAALWNEVEDRLSSSALGLSGGQQQRLCIARALAVEPEVLLMDEPTSALDPISTSKIEELAMQLREKYTIVIVTHNMQQAVRISDNTAFFLLGELIEYGNTEQIFSQPGNKKTEDYITGRFG